MRCGSLYSEIRHIEKGAVLYNIVFLVRRQVYIVTAVMCTDWPFLQVMVYLYLCTGHMIYLWEVMPFGHPNMNYLEMFNEMCVLAAGYHLIVFSQLVDDFEMKYNAGWSIIALTVLSILVNMGFMLYNSFKLLRKAIRKLKAKLA